MLPSSGSNPATRALSPSMVLLLITALFAMQPLATDLYLPSLPGLGRDLGVDPIAVQSTLSIFVLGFAFGQLAIGPLSDRFGRLPVLLIGSCVFCLASLACAFAPSIHWLVTGRFFQALGACSGLVCARAMVRDLFTPQEGARTLATSAMYMACAPLLGPILGGYLEVHFGWRAAFLVLSGISALLLVSCALYLTETIEQKNRLALRIRPLLSSYRSVLNDRRFLAYALAGAVSYAGLFAFISGSSYVFIDVLHIEPRLYGACYAFAVLGYLGGAALCRSILPRKGIQHTIYLGATLSVTAGLTMAALALAGIQHPLALLLPEFVYMIAHGMIQPCAQAGAIAHFPEKAGTAAALMGFLLMALASVVGWWIGISFNHTVYPLALTIGGASVAVAAVAFCLVRRNGSV